MPQPARIDGISGVVLCARSGTDLALPEVGFGRYIIRLALTALLLGGCGSSDPVDSIRFAEPVQYQVRKGDTLFAISRDNDVKLGELMEWNGLTNDRIEVDQRLLLWRLPKEEPTLAGSLLARVRSDDKPVAAATKVPAKRRPRPRRKTSHKVVVIAPVVVEAPDIERQRIAVNVHSGSVRTAGIMGALGSDALNGGLDEELSDSVYALNRSERSDRGVKLGGRNLAGGGTAETVDIERRQRVSSGPNVPNVAVNAPNLRRPAAKRCLSGPKASDLTVDEGHIASEGLSIDQIRRSMNGFVRHTMACFPKGTRGSFTFSTEITVGCDGRVTDVWVANDGGLPPAVSQCISGTLGYASFPAHALPDGMTFQYPIQYRY